ncbi:hypothetical protein BAE44_0003003 [Dichanthelium oligosanthes]|uniref:Uncharacterized protein n=1 Tax=Dichanthelium oligosanthes TaxID=888268 RepID=A0A1E5WEY6_9POAL|nr:hypothetical protein BAE44_0003003 [Dichanthelium oligosanthes]
MKREGWQHGGTVRINRNKLLRVAAAAAAADGEEKTAVVGAAMAQLGKAPAAKPTNASKATGKCRRPRCAGCHHHPVTKARDKAKGAHKLRASDVALNHRLVSWRVVDGAGGAAGVPDYRGTSASSLLAYLAGSGSSWHEDDDDGGSLLETNPPGDGGLSDLYDLFVGRRADADPAHATDIEAVGDTDAIEEQDKDGDDVKEDEDGEEDEDMGFCMVGITIAVEFSDGEEDWIVVEEI